MLLLAFVLTVCLPSLPNAAPTIEAYVKQAGEAVKIIPAGQLIFDGKRASCGKRPTVMHPGFDDYGGSYPGYVILNPDKLKGLPTAVKFYIYSHECGHQFQGEGEDAADCFAVKRGRRYGWLTRKGLDEVCHFMWSHKADFSHTSGPERCKAMRKCYEATAPKTRSQ